MPVERCGYCQAIDYLKEVVSLKCGRVGRCGGNDQCGGDGSCDGVRKCIRTDTLNCCDENFTK